MIDEKILEEALRAIVKLNSEVGGIQIIIGSLQTSIGWIKSILFWQMGLMGAVLTSILINIRITRRNGRR